MTKCVLPWYIKSVHTSPTKLQAALLSVWFCQSLTTAIAFCLDCPKNRLNVYRQCKMLLQELSWNAKKQITSLPFLGSFIGFLSRNGSATKFSLPLTGQFMITPPSTSLISKNTTLLAFSDQHLDLSLMFPGPGIPRQSGTASEPSDMSLPPSGMSSPRASRRRTPFSLSDLCWKPISLPRDDSQCDCVCAPALVCVLSEVDVAIITLCVCVCVCVILFSVIIICNSVYIFTFNCYV